MKWPFYRLMDEGGDPGGGGGTPPKDPPADPPKGKEKPQGGDPPGDPPPPKTVSIDVLPEELRDRPEAEQKFLLEHMVQSLGTSNKKVRDLETQLAELRGEVAAGRKPPEPDPDEGKPLSELMLEDPDKAIERWMKDRGYLDAFQNLSGRVGETEFALVRQELDDFDEYEEDIKTILEEGKLAPTRTNIRGAYTMAVGNKVLREKATARRSGTGTIPPDSPPPGEGGKDEPKWRSDLEREIAEAHGVTDPSEWYEHSGDKPMKLKLPS